MEFMSRSRWVRARHLLAKLTVAGVLMVAAACGSKKSEAAGPVTDNQSQDQRQDPNQTPRSACGVTEGTALTTEQCSCLGGSVRTDPGNGSVQCDEGATQLGRVKVGIEGGICCAAPANAANGGGS